jgi:hypothetical protein
MKSDELIVQARIKGYKQTNDASFQALCDIQMWLMTEYKIFISIGPFRGRFSYFVVTPDQKNPPFTIASHNTWMGAYIAAIEAALNALPT